MKRNAAFNWYVRQKQKRTSTEILSIQLKFYVDLVRIWLKHKMKRIFKAREKWNFSVIQHFVWISESFIPSSPYFRNKKHKEKWVYIYIYIKKNIRIVYYFFLLNNLWECGNSLNRRYKVKKITICTKWEKNKRYRKFPPKNAKRN